ncbi:p33 [Cryptophlebia peltastica nucleopolyhedrovirus]|uniref:p33 n=1 Tax=Cryptophlebia peltastica nucleopolyhedrovirus TaxID=2304025 RepID=A0A346RNU0_9ABAC|nr:p33 [Cryptophlebia peltastica nucleopolyhedrovirus]AXS67737.1 p33 [Cryptophlebia peltastica nucleopolyhedrovirus]
MIPPSLLLSRYRNSFLLHLFRHLDRIRTSKSKQLTKILCTELTYLYELACIITYKDIQKYEIDEIKKWVLSLDAAFDLEHMKVIFQEKMVELNLRAFQPNDYTYTFTSIWDFIHFLSLLVDDMVNNRDKLKHDQIINHIRQIKAIYYNLFFVLNCPMCRDHYLSVKGFMIVALERIEIAMHKEKFGNKILLINDIVPANVTKNILMKYGTLYSSMAFHNHINDYRFVQRNISPPANLEKMDWEHYKSLLNIV